MAALPPYVSDVDEGMIVSIFVQPRAAKDAIVGVHGEALKLKVRAIPEEGRANRAAAALVATTVGVPTKAVELVSGGSSRHKRFRISGTTADRVARELGAVLSSRAHEPRKEADQAAGGRQDHGKEGHFQEDDK